MYASFIAKLVGMGIGMVLLSACNYTSRDAFTCLSEEFFQSFRVVLLWKRDKTTGKWSGRERVRVIANLHFD
jgi:hypothetical protein